MDEPQRITLSAAPLGCLVWHVPHGSTALSSAAVGGGWSTPDWVLSLRVERGYHRLDLATHVGEVAEATGLNGNGIGLLTAANLDNFGSAQERGLRVDVTAGISDPTWAASDDIGETAPRPGTVNIVATLPIGLEAGAAVNAVATITEAKTQAFFERNVPGTGTATDAVVVVWRTSASSPEPFCGPRSPWGARLARATRDAVSAAIDQAEGAVR